MIDRIYAELFVLLLAGHLIGDFLIQTRYVAANKHRALVLLRHGGELLLIHAVLLVPFKTPSLGLVLIPLVVLHLGIDTWKTRAPRGLRSYLLERGWHLLALIAAVAAVGLIKIELDPLHNPCRILAWTSLIIGLISFLWRGGRSIVELATGALKPKTKRDDRLGAGATVGVLERLIVFVLILVGQWGVIGFVFAAKSIARFRELDNKEFADYYLAGTLSSILVAILAGLVAITARGVVLGG